MDPVVFLCLYTEWGWTSSQSVSVSGKSLLCAIVFACTQCTVVFSELQYDNAMLYLRVTSLRTCAKLPIFEIVQAVA